MESSEKTKKKRANPHFRFEGTMKEIQETNKAAGRSFHGLLSLTSQQQQDHIRTLMASTVAAQYQFFQQHPTYVYKLHKSIYGLKQAPRSWYDKLAKVLLSLGFVTSYADTFLFVQKIDQGITIMLVYVDIIATGSDSSYMDSNISELSNHFLVKYLGKLHFFLDLEVKHTPDGLVLSQANYDLDLLKRTNMLECKPCSSPIATHSQLNSSDSDLLNDATEYMSIVCVLHYLTSTRPGTCYVPTQIYQNMPKPNFSHLAAAKGVLRYGKGHAYYGIQCNKGDMLLTVFSNADWAGDISDIKSTGGFCIFFGSIIMVCQETSHNIKIFN